MAAGQIVPTEFQWTPQPAAEAWVQARFDQVLKSLPDARRLSERFRSEAGVRMIDLIDNLVIGNAPDLIEKAKDAGWTHRADEEDLEIYRNPRGMFPMIAVVRKLPATHVAIELKVESIPDFLGALGLMRKDTEPAPYPVIRGVVWGPALGVVARQGQSGYYHLGTAAPESALRALESFRARRRKFEIDEEGFSEAIRLIDRAIDEVGRDAACHFFFKAEREYWQSRNHAGQVQYARQQKLGLGWANHDHHTYRCSREHFTKLIAIWEKLGFHCRERFYAGKEAGWGAQVMEQPNAGIVTFNDVDLSPEELTTDFAHEPLPPRDHLGTVGLWCGLHGESFLQAGMHHLECQFDFDALKRQLESESDVKVMKPFTNYPYLKQAFTEGERWAVDPSRIERLLRAKRITPEQAEQFRTQGAIGSHLENLERNQGFKGFNQQGVSEIIAATDPRKH